MIGKDDPQREAMYGLPVAVRFCKKCVMSNQRPSTTVEFKNRSGTKTTIEFDEDGVCSACRYNEEKWNVIDWEARERQLRELLDRHRKDDGSYDVIVPGSGGKDSIYVAHVLKNKYGMRPLTVTWAPHRYTEIGRRNLDAWIDAGFDNVLVTPNSRVHRLLTREAFLNLLHPFQPFIIGQKQIAVKAALQHGVKLLVYGESPAETGSDISFASTPAMPPEYYAAPRDKQWDLVLGGKTTEELLALGLHKNDLLPYVPAALEDVRAAEIEYHFMGYYTHWRVQDRYYYAAENGGFTANPERTEGTYTKMSSLDDRIDGFHYFTTYIKFGIGRATYDAARDVRDRYIERDEAAALVRRYDGEFPHKYFEEFLEYIEIDEDRFWQRIDEARSPHLWKKVDNEWVLRHQVE
jgi:N-acetyl sugar amidotransferase